MCGRFALRLSHQEIRNVPGHPYVHVNRWIDEDEFVPRYNIAPRTNAPVIRRFEQGHGEDADSMILHTMKWGLVPHWSKFEDKSLSTTNARSENLVDGGGMWASLKGKKRCAVVCTGYYEWLTKGKEKLPHYIKHKDGQVMLMAGLYDSTVLEGQNKALWTFTIVTTSANKEFDWLHDRQPVILSTKEALDIWLDTSSQTWTPALTKLVEPFHDSGRPLECYQVPREVGKVGTESPTFIEPITKRKDGIQAMFARQEQAQSQLASERSSGVKRKWNQNPEASFSSGTAAAKQPLDNKDEGVKVPDGPSMPKVKRLNTPERVSPKTPTKSPAKRSSPPKPKAEGSAKITSFFKS